MFVLNYLAVPATEFDQLAADDDQVDTVHELLESAEYPITDIDKAWGPLSMVVGESPIMGAIAGTQEWDEEVTANPPALVAEQAAALAARGRGPAGRSSQRARPRHPTRIRGRRGGGAHPVLPGRRRPG